MNCLSCGAVLRFSEHPRIKLCDKCYQAKRKDDMDRNIKRLRGKVIKPKKIKTDDQTLNLIINKLTDKGHKVVDAKIDDQNINITVEGNVVINLPEQWQLKFNAEENTTEIYYNFDLMREIHKEIDDKKLVESIANYFVCTQKRELLKFI